MSQQDSQVCPFIISLCHHRGSCSSRKLLSTAGFGALQVLGHCFLSPPGDGARGSQAYRNARCLLSSKKGTHFIRRGPQAKTQSKTASAQLGESKITPGLEHSCSSRTYTCSKRSSGGRALPFPARPCETPAAQPSLSPPLLARAREGSPQGWDALCPKPHLFPTASRSSPRPGGRQFRIRLRS